MIHYDALSVGQKRRRTNDRSRKPQRIMGFTVLHRNVGILEVYMFSFAEYLRENDALLHNKRELKRIFLRAEEFSGSPGMVTAVLSAYDTGICALIQSGQIGNDIVSAKIHRDLINSGLTAQEAQSAIDFWLELCRQLQITPAESCITPENGLLTEEKLAGLACTDIPVQDQQTIFHEISYINPSIPDGNGGIYIPCGIGATDYGFYVHGISPAKFCTHKDADIYALVYNFLIRNTCLNIEDFPQFIQERNQNEFVDLRSVYRLSIVLLLLIRHNRITGNTVCVQVADIQILKDAIAVINTYATAFARLLKKPIRLLTPGNNSKIIPVYLDGKTSSGVSVENNAGVHSPARTIWYGRKLRYHLQAEDLPNVEFFLHAISPFQRFREGQYEALCNMLNAQTHCVCIMPTGAGKSLIYYLASLLQPLPLFVVTPTDILIEDQLRNLKVFHRMDNAAHLVLTADNSFERFEIACSLNYLTPATLQCRNLLVQFRYINNGTRLVDKHEERVTLGPKACYVVLDEIHCISNWGHDFRPDYLMLSRYLNRYLDQTTFWGFTATANYTVVQDVQKQLSIPEACFFSPLAFEKYNISYHYYQEPSTEAMLARLKVICDYVAERGEQTIVFTKSDAVSEKAADVIGYEADVFSSDNPYAYRHFVEGKCRILISTGELGIGINFPEIKNIIHFGIPLSKNAYVQEIGRAGRGNEQVASYVIFLEASSQTVPAGILGRNIDLDELPERLCGLDNDFADAYRIITNNCTTRQVLTDQLMKLYTGLDYQKQAMYIHTLSLPEERAELQKLYMLYTAGYVNDFYAYAFNSKASAVDILVDICSTNAMEYRTDPNRMVQRMRKRLCDYFEFMGNDREVLSKVNRAHSEEEIIHIYVDWYFSRFLYNQNEQFVDLYSFLVSNVNSDRNQITQEIREYFRLPFIQLKTDELFYLSLSIPETIEKGIAGVGPETLMNLERINSSRYCLTIDLMLLFGHYRTRAVFETERLKRILQKAAPEERTQIFNALPGLYGFGRPEAKLEMLRCFADSEKSLQRFLKKVYAAADKDLIYYGFAAQRINRLLKKKQEDTDYV